jgi:hypothetical protein
MVTPYLLNFFTFYSETEGFFLQSFNPKLNVEESFNQYISFFKYEIKIENKTHIIYVYPRNKNLPLYHYLPDSAFTNSEYMNQTIRKYGGLNSSWIKRYERDGYFLNLEDTCKLVLVDKNTIVQRFPNNYKFGDPIGIWYYRKY